MKKQLIKFVAAGVMALFAGAAQADFLYSMVENASLYYKSGTIDFDYATVKASGSELPLYFYAPGETTSDTWKMYADPSNPGSTAGANLCLGAYALVDSSYTSFMFELWDASGNQLAWKTYTRDEVQSYIFGTTSTGGATPLKVGTNMVPEPTSGLLLLMGLAGLALKRRKLA